MTAVVSCLKDLSWRDLYAYAASAELNSEHPLGKAIVRSYKEEMKNAPSAPEDFKMLPGRGVQAFVQTVTRVLAGNLELFAENDITLTEEMTRKADLFLGKGCTVIYLAADNRSAGFIALSDTLRQNASDTIDAVKACGVTPVLLTGDHENAAATYRPAAPYQ